MNARPVRRAAPVGPSCCYVLGDRGSARSYCGVTNDLSRRTLQHNGRRVGGARYTRGREWRVLATVEGFTSRSQCLAFEWHMKHGGPPPPGASLTPPMRRCARLLHTAGTLDRWWRRHPPRPERLIIRSHDPTVDTVLRERATTLPPWISVVEVPVVVDGG